MKYLLLLCMITLLFIGWSCSSTKDTSDLSKLTKVAEMYKSACFGKCPVFTVTVYNNGLVSYNGKRNTDKQGLYVRQLPKSQLKELCKAFDAADFWNHPDNYPSNISDVPKITIKYFKKGKIKSVQGDIERPEVIMNLEKMLDGIANGGEWEQREGPVREEVTLNNEIIVHFKADTDIPTWIEKLARYDVQLIKQIAPNSPYWLISFNPEKMVPGKMLQMVKNSEGVTQAQFNQKVEYRDQ